MILGSFALFKCNSVAQAFSENRLKGAAEDSKREKMLCNKNELRGNYKDFREEVN